MEPHVEKIAELTNDNYISWQKDIRAILIERKCWDLVCGVEKEPLADASYRKKRHFLHKKDRAYVTIYFNISKNLRRLISETRDGKRAWEILKTHFQPDSRVRTIELLDSFFSCSMKKGETLGVYASRLRKIISQLQGYGHTLEDVYQVFQLIRFLSIDFKEVIHSMCRWPDAEFKFSNVLEELVAEEARQSQIKVDQEEARQSQIKVDQEEARQSQIKVNQEEAALKPEGEEPLKELKDVKCGKMEQFEFDCRVPNAEEDTVKETSRKENITNSYTTVTCLDSPYTRAWLFDSGSMFHFCKNREWFDTFTPSIKTKKALAAKNTFITVEGTGTVILEFKVRGKIRRVHLNDVCYSPDLRKNIISGSQFDLSGAGFKGKHGRLSVYTKDNKKIFMAMLYKGLYFCNPINVKLRKEASTVQLLFDSQTLIEKFNDANNRYVSNYLKLNPRKSIVKCVVCRKTRRKSFNSFRENLF
ncbi:retrovirus-related Pol polyprotein from transposon TNT 1-94 [Nephila pilipes]|uniref:Retrovirus-related Pol polyprotein from transposon TNT 1-94 n=1 Tax=Nephila pilipes TaxID=299642 RepID=A0A8X6T5Y9_NEPPI|nr:retrovirus-related Pol polyprotein from transposon TNT 1-94 [Nephila pilipes]